MAQSNGADSRPWAYLDRDFILAARAFRSRHTFPVFCAYLSFTDRTTGLAWPSKMTVAQAVGIRLREVRRSVDELVLAHLLAPSGHRQVAGRMVVAYSVTLLPGVGGPGGAEPQGYPRPSTRGKEAPLPLGPVPPNPTMILPVILGESAAPAPDQDRPLGSGAGEDAGEREELPEPGTYPDCPATEVA